MWSRLALSDLHLRRIGVFGSAARDRLTRDSDIDVVVELAEPDLLLVGIQQELQTLMGMRDVLSHHYFDLNEEVVFGVVVDALDNAQQGTSPTAPLDASTT